MATIKKIFHPTVRLERAFVLISCIVFLTDCEKDPSLQPAPQYPLSNTASLVTRKVVTSYSTIEEINYSIEAYFERAHKDGTLIIGPITYVTVDKVMVDSLNIDTIRSTTPWQSLVYYEKNMDTVNLNYERWQIKGGNVFPSFTYQNPFPFPTVSHNINTIDSVSKSTGFTFTVLAQGMTGIGQLVIGDSLPTCLNFIEGSNTINLTPALTTSLVAGRYYNFRLVCTHSHSLQISETRCFFTKAYTFSRHIKIY